MRTNLFSIIGYTFSFYSAKKNIIQTKLQLLADMAVRIADKPLSMEFMSHFGKKIF